MPSEELDKDRLARRAEVLQRLADQLACQLEVERRSNEELRSLAGEAGRSCRAADEERAATHRFMTFAAVAVFTAAAVAMLVAEPWRSSAVYLDGPPDLRLSAPMELGPAKGGIVGSPGSAARWGAIVPFSVIDIPRPACGLSGPKLRISQDPLFECDSGSGWELTRVP
ncbi:MAG: hypothetical protein HYY06_06840 [Deltaproteobacteria bacterium]|nr:hypothetical protein [Deltaproteobacteria bacterium]